MTTWLAIGGLRDVMTNASVMGGADAALALLAITD
jgi:hypothetical protein